MPNSLNNSGIFSVPSAPKTITDYGAIAKSMASDFPKPKKSSKEEQAMSMAQNNQLFAQKAVAELQDIIKNNQEFQNGSLTRKENLLRDYRDNIFKNYLQENPAFFNNPDLKMAVSTNVNNFLNGELKNIEKEQRSWGNTFQSLGMSLGKGFDDIYDQLVTLTSTSSSPTQMQEDAALRKDMEDQENYSYGMQMADLRNKLKAAQDAQDAEREKESRQRIVELNRAHTQNLFGIDRQFRDVQSKRNDEELKDARNLVKEMQKSYKNEQERINSNPVYADLRQRPAELEEMYGPDSWGLQGHHNFLLTATDWLLTNAPQIALSTAAGIAGGVGGTLAGGPAAGVAGARLALGVVGALQSVGGVGQQIIQDVMDASDKDLSSIPEYQEIYKNLESRITDETERKNTAKAIIALQAAQEAAPKAAAIGAALNQFGVEAALSKAGVIKALQGKGLLKRAGRGVTSALGEGVEEVVENAESIAATNKALNQDRSWFEDWRQNFVQGAFVGGPLGTLSGARREEEGATEKKATAKRGAPATATGTASTVTGGPTVQENIRASVMSTDNPFYNPESTKTTAADVDTLTRDLQEATANMQRELKRTPEGADPQFADKDILSITEALTTIVESNAGKNDGVFAVSAFLENFNKATGLNWTFDDFTQRTNEILARQEQGAQNAAATAQGGETDVAVNGTDQGLNTGNPPAEATTQTDGTTAGQQNTQTDTGSSAAAESTRLSWPAYTEPGATAPYVSPDQSAYELGAGAYGRRDNTVNGAIGTQPDIGTGSTTGTPEQRPSNDGRATTAGPTEQTGSTVAQRIGSTVPADQNLTSGELLQDIFNASTPEEEAAAVAKLNEYGIIDRVPSMSAPEQRAVAQVNSDLRNQVTHTYHSVEYDIAQSRIYDMIYKALGNEEAASAATQLYMRMALSLSHIMHRKILDVLPLSGVNVRVIEDNSNLRGRYDAGRKIIELFIANPEDLNSTAFAHELTHAFIDYVLDHITIIQDESRNGNDHATNFLQDFKAFAKACKVPEGQEFTKAGWDKNGKTGHERAAIAMEHFIVNRDNRPVNPELDQLVNNSFVARLRDFFDRAMQTMHEYLFAIADRFKGVRRGNIVSFRKLLDMRRRRGRTWLTWNEELTNGSFDDPELFVYTKANYDYLHFGLPQDISGFFDRLASGYDNHITNDWLVRDGKPVVRTQAEYDRFADDAIYAGATADADLQITALAAQIMSGGADMGTSIRSAVERVQQAMEIKNGETPEVFIYDARKQGLDETSEANPGFAMTFSMNGLAASPYASAVLTTDNDMYNLASGLNTPAQNAQLNMNTSPDDTGHGTSQPTEMEGELSPEEEAVAVEDTIDAIDSELGNGEVAGDFIRVSPTTAFVSYYGNENILHNEDGSAKAVYRVGRMIREVPSGAETEVTTFVATGNIVDDVKAFDILDNPAQDLQALSGSDLTPAQMKQTLVKFYNRTKKAALAGKQIRATKEESDALLWLWRAYGLNVDTFKFTDANGNAMYYISELQQSEDVYTATNGHENTYDLRVAANMDTEPETTTGLVDKLAAMIKAISDRNTGLAKENRDRVSAAKADMYSTSMTGSQESNWWMRYVTRMRARFGDAQAAFRRFCVENFTPLVGAVDSSPIYQMFVMSRARVRGAKAELREKILRPFNKWVAEIASQSDRDPQELAQKMGQLYTFMHTLEAAKRQEQELQRAVIAAQMDMSPNREDNITKAKADLAAYYAYQDDPEHAKPVKIYGGVPVKIARQRMEQLVAELGDDLAEQAVGRLQRAYGDLVSLLIQRGTLSEQDVANFGEWAYYCPLITNTEYTGTIQNEVISLFPAKLNYHRGGSTDAAVDAFTALEYMVSRSANALGSVDLGRETMAGYRILRDRYNEGLEDNLSDGENNGVRHRRVKISGNLYIDFYNGMGAVPMRTLEGLTNSRDDTTASIAKHYKESCDLMVRVNEVINDGNLQESVPYGIIFDPKDPKVADVKKAFAAPFHMELPEQPIENGLVNTGTGRWGKFMSKTTSGLAQLNTTYRPWFPPINAGRDYVERTYYASGKTYRDADGNAIPGTTIAARITANMSHIPDILHAVLTGRPEDIDGEVGELLSEFKRQGIMTSASLRGMLEHASDNTLAFVQKAIESYEKGASLKDTIGKLARATKQPFRIWAEMCYSIPTTTMYMALRQSGVSENAAAYYVTEMMNLGQKGQFTEKASKYFPFLASIGQTSMQLFNYFGLNIATFGTTRNWKDPEIRQNLARAYTLFGGTAAVTGLLLPMIASMFGDGDDDKGWKILDNMDLGSFNFLPFPIGDSEYVKIQLGFGPTPFAAQLAIGISRIIRGTDSLGHVTGQLMDSFIRNVSPLAGPDYTPKSAEDVIAKFFQTVCPSVFTPALNVVANKTYFGQEIISDKYRQGVDRNADIDKDSTEKFYKDVAKFFADHGLDMAPESVKEIMSGYATGVFGGVREWITQDPLTKDPAYAGLRETLGPWYTALGASMAFGSVGNVEQNLYYNYLRTYEDLFRRSGLSKSWKLTDAEKSAGISAPQKRARMLAAAGFDSRIVDDYTTLLRLDNRLRDISKRYHKQIDAAVRSGLPHDSLQELYDSMRSERTLEISSALPAINLHNGILKRSEIELPDREQIRLVRGD